MACIFCKCANEDTLSFGDKITQDNITAHYFCLLLSSNLCQKTDINEGILGFLPADIQAEVKRASKLHCHFCKKSGASIGCSISQCRRSFHLSCALKEDCRFDFNGPYELFCPKHNDILQPLNVHRPADSCTICFDEMGAYNLIRSIQTPCCNKWYHQRCLKQYAMDRDSSQFKCPSCNNSEEFHKTIQSMGVFVPDREDNMEVIDDVINHMCKAKDCLCPGGRNYHAFSMQDNDYAWLLCNSCGANAVHRACSSQGTFVCDVCSIE